MPCPKFTGFIGEDGRFHLNFPERYKAHLMTLPKGYPLEMMGPRIPRRDAEKWQKHYWGAVVLWTCKNKVKRFDGWSEREISNELYRSYSPQVYEPGKPERPLRLSEMSKTQADELFAQVRQGVLETDGVIILEPNETEF